MRIERLQKKGYEYMLDYYFKVAPQFNEPLYTWPVGQPCAQSKGTVVYAFYFYFIGMHELALLGWEVLRVS